MAEYTSTYSPRTSLAAVGAYLREQKIWEVIEAGVTIKQKAVKYKATDKLLDCFINILAGGEGLVEINTRVRPDRGLQATFGRDGCAEQSVVSTTVNACGEETVRQLRAAVGTIYRQHSQGYRHDYEAQYQVLEVDLSGLPAGRQGEGVTKGYFAVGKNRRGRQVGRVCASLYEEIVCDQLFEGKRQLQVALSDLVLASEHVLDLDEARRRRTILRVDAGGGTDDNINWLLVRGYPILVKVHNWRRASRLARSVIHWVADPAQPTRELGWVQSSFDYVRPTQQVAVRTRKANGQWSYAVLVSSLSPEALHQLIPQPDPLFALVYAYDLRGGGVETQFRQDKQALGLSKRNKARFSAQEMLVLLAQLAHNLLIWTRNQLARATPVFQSLGLLRLVRDVLHIPGQLTFDDQARLVQITLQLHHPFARPFLQAFSAFFPRDDLSLILHQI